MGAVPIFSLHGTPPDVEGRCCPLAARGYVLADGTKVPSPRFRIRSLKVGNKTLENVTASISANSDLFRPGVTTRSRTALRFDVGHHSDLKPVTSAG
jgi:hypothetical protein